MEENLHAVLAAGQAEIGQQRDGPLARGAEKADHWNANGFVEPGEKEVAVVIAVAPQSVGFMAEATLEALDAQDDRRIRKVGVDAFRDGT